MIEPISAMATASAAFSALKKGFAVGRDIESMASDIGRWMGALSDLDQAEKEAKNPPIFKKLFSGKSVEQEAMEAFANKRKAQQQREELKNWIEFTLGRKAWTDLISQEAAIRKQRQETIYLQREKRRKFIAVVGWILMSLVGFGVLTAFVMLLMAHQAKASTNSDYVICRKSGCTKIDNQRVCVYRGAGNTQETMFFNLTEWTPDEYQCKYDPNAVRPPSLKETLDAIRESQK